MASQDPESPATYYMYPVTVVVGLWDLPPECERTWQTKRAVSRIVVHEEL